MLLPRFTIRALLLLVTVSSLIFVIVGMAYRGQFWARGVTIGIASLAFTALVHAVWFGLVWMIAQFRSHPEETTSRSLE